MLRTIASEFMKLKRSIILKIILGSAGAMPFFMFLAFSEHYHARGEYYSFVDLCERTLMFFSLGIGVMLLGLLASHLFVKEYQERTIESWLVIPVKRSTFILSKLIVLYLLAILFMMTMFGTSLLLATVMNLDDVTVEHVIYFFGRHLFMSQLLFFLSMPVVFLSLYFKSSMPPIGFTVMTTFITLLTFNSDYVSIYPYSAPFTLIFPGEMAGVPAVAWISIGITSVLFLAASLILIHLRDVD